MFKYSLVAIALILVAVACNKKQEEAAAPAETAPAAAEMAPAEAAPAEAAPAEEAPAE